MPGCAASVLDGHLFIEFDPYQHLGSSVSKCYDLRNQVVEGRDRTQIKVRSYTFEPYGCIPR